MNAIDIGHALYESYIHLARRKVRDYEAESYFTGIAFWWLDLAAQEEK